MALLRKAGRTRGIDAEAARLREAFRTGQMHQLPLVEAAMGRQALALPGQLNAACAAADDLEQADRTISPTHLDNQIASDVSSVTVPAGQRAQVKVPSDRTRKVTLDPESSTDTPARNQRAGGSLPGPGAGHPLQGAGSHPL